MNDGMAKLCRRCQVIAAEDRFPASTEMLENGEITLDLNCTTEYEPEIIKGWRAFRGIKKTYCQKSLVLQYTLVDTLLYLPFLKASAASKCDLCNLLRNRLLKWVDACKKIVLHHTGPHHYIKICVQIR